MLPWLSQLLTGPLRTAPDLDEPHAALDEPRREQAAPAKVLGHFVVEPVAGTHGGRLAHDIERFRSAQLHFRGEFIARDARVESRIAGMRGGVRSIHFVEQGEAVAIRVAAGERELFSAQRGQAPGADWRH